jgi:hypothetical protein
MIPVVKKDPPAITEELKDAVRNRMAFTTADTNISGFHSARKHTFLVQCEGMLVALYDKKAEHWFVDESHTRPSMAWTAQLVIEAVDEATMVPYRMLRAIQLNGFVAVVRKRLNVAKEK